jgi:hypothetical protein
MKIEVNLDKKYVFLVLSVIIFLTCGIIVFAFNSNGFGGNPAIMGHSADEIMINLSNGSIISVQNLLVNGVSTNGTSNINLGVKKCYAVQPTHGSSPACRQGFYMKAIMKYTDDNWDGYGAICCSADDNIADLTLMNYSYLASQCPWGWGSRVSCANIKGSSNLTTYPTGYSGA